jgi:ADP-ribosyl-[dinitrogen reductase] hydrolase
MTLDLNAAQLDRAAGVLLGMACGDALGAPYEFGPPLGADVRVRMAGGVDRRHLDGHRYRRGLSPGP